MDHEFILANLLICLLGDQRLNFTSHDHTGRDNSRDGLHNKNFWGCRLDLVSHVLRVDVLNFHNGFARTSMLGPDQSQHLLWHVMGDEGWRSRPEYNKESQNFLELYSLLLRNLVVHAVKSFN